MTVPSSSLLLAAVVVVLVFDLAATVLPQLAMPPFVIPYQIVKLDLVPETHLNMQPLPPVGGVVPAEERREEAGQEIVPEPRLAGVFVLREQSLHPPMRERYHRGRDGGVSYEFPDSPFQFPDGRGGEDPLSRSRGDDPQRHVAIVVAAASSTVSSSIHPRV